MHAPRRTKGSRVRETEGGGVSKPSATSLFRGRALNFPRLNRSTAVMVVWCFLPLLSARVRRKVAKAHVSSLGAAYTRGRDIKGGLPLLREFEFLLDGLPRRLSLAKFMFRK